MLCSECICVQYNTRLSCGTIKSLLWPQGSSYLFFLTSSTACGLSRQSALPSDAQPGQKRFLLIGPDFCLAFCLSSETVSEVAEHRFCPIATQRPSPRCFRRNNNNIFLLSMRKESWWSPDPGREWSTTHRRRYFTDGFLDKCVGVRIYIWLGIISRAPAMHSI